MKTNPLAHPHTPGPWNVEQPYGEPGVFIAGPDTGLICRLYDTSGRHITKNDTLHANAQLIAAAPELLAALKMFVAEYEGDGADDRELRPEMIAARNAIGKADGTP